MQPSRQSIGKAGWRSLASSWARCTVKIAALNPMAQNAGRPWQGADGLCPHSGLAGPIRTRNTLIRDEVILECAPADIKILHQMQQSIEEKRMK